MKLRLNLKPRVAGEGFEGKVEKVDTDADNPVMHDMMLARGFDSVEPIVLFDAIDKACNITLKTYKLDAQWEQSWNDFVAQWNMDFQHMLDDAFTRNEEALEMQN